MAKFFFGGSIMFVIWITHRYELILHVCETVPRAGFGVVRIDLLHFLAGCRKKRLNQALSVLSLSLGFL